MWDRKLDLGFIAVIAALWSINSYAKDGDQISQIYYQPDGGQFSIEAMYFLTKYDYEYKTAGVPTASFASDQTQMAVDLMYGLSDNVAIGIEVGHSKVNVEVNQYGSGISKVSGSGLFDPAIKFRGIFGSKWKLRFGAEARISPSEQKAMATDKDGNSFSGGHSILVYISPEALMGPVAIGVGLEHVNKLERKANDQGAPSSTISTIGGSITTIRPYVDVNLKRFGIGLYYAMQSVGVEMEDWGGVLDKYPSYTISTIGSAARYSFSDTFQLIALYSIDKYKDATPDTTYDKVSYDRIHYALGFRATF